ncbi:MAG: hypothetical protein Q4G63_10180 [Bacteroidia bacterium]|nr:hypothetical protein [Bacteroidia bacterium]
MIQRSMLTFGALRGSGFVALISNRRTNIQMHEKVSNEAFRPLSYKTLVSGSLLLFQFFYRVACK